MGLVVVVLDTGTGWDVLPDPLGWLLALPAVALLPAGVRTPPLAAGAVAALVSLLVWPPAGRELLAGVDPSIDWLVLLVPDLAFGALLCWALGRAARATERGGSSGRRAPVDRAGGVWPSLAFLFVVAALGPAPFLAAGSPVPGDLALLTQLCWLALLVLLFWWHRATWAPTRSRAGRDDGPPPPGDGPASRVG